MLISDKSASDSHEMKQTHWTRNQPKSDSLQ